MIFGFEKLSYKKRNLYLKMFISYQKSYFNKYIIKLQNSLNYGNLKGAPNNMSEFFLLRFLVREGAYLAKIYTPWLRKDLHALAVPQTACPQGIHLQSLRAESKERGKCK